MKKKVLITGIAVVAMVLGIILGYMMKKPAQVQFTEKKSVEKAEQKVTKKVAKVSKLKSTTPTPQIQPAPTTVVPAPAPAPTPVTVNVYCNAPQPTPPLQANNCYRRPTRWVPGHYIYDCGYGYWKWEPQTTL